MVVHKNISQKHYLSLLFFASRQDRHSWCERIKAFGIRLWKFNSMHFFPISVNKHNKKHETTAKTTWHLTYAINRRVGKEKNMSTSYNMTFYIQKTCFFFLFTLTFYILLFTQYVILFQFSFMNSISFMWNVCDLWC